MADSTPKSYSADPTLYLYTSLTAGSSHIITATSRLETILKANKIPFRALDVATDEKARMLWGRRSKGKKLPGLVKFGTIVGDLEEVEEWNEYGELKQQIGATPAVTTTPAGSTTTTPSKPPTVNVAEEKTKTDPASESEHISIREPAEGHRKSSVAALKKDDTPLTMAMRQAGAEAAAKAGQKKVVKPGPLMSDNPTSPDAVAPTGEAKLGKASEDPSTEIAAAKAPTQLAADGAKRTSVDKIAGSESGAGVEVETPKSADQNLLDLGSSSSITKAKSSLVKETGIETIPDVTEEPGEVKRDDGGQLGGSSVEEAEAAKGKELETAEAISEKKEAEEDHKDEPVLNAQDVSASDSQEKSATEEKKPQDQEANDGEEASVSVGD